MIRKHFVWRERERVDELLKLHLQGQLFSAHEIMAMKQHYPHGFCGVSKCGHPVYYERLGKLDTKKLLQVTTLDRFLQYYIAETEKNFWYRFYGCDQYVHSNGVTLDEEDHTLVRFFDKFSTKNRAVVESGLNNSLR